MSEQKSISQQYHVVKRQNQQIINNRSCHRITLLSCKTVENWFLNEKNCESSTSKNHQYDNDLECTSKFPTMHQFLYPGRLGHSSIKFCKIFPHPHLRQRSFECYFFLFYRFIFLCCGFFCCKIKYKNSRELIFIYSLKKLMTVKLKNP